jgi:porphobilinogen deaminase
VPVAAYAIRDGEELFLRAMLAEADGTRARFAETRAPFPGETTAAFALGAALGRGLKSA